MPERANTPMILTMDVLQPDVIRVTIATADGSQGSWVDVPAAGLLSMTTAIVQEATP